MNKVKWFHLLFDGLGSDKSLAVTAEDYTEEDKVEL